jgi:DNA-3-methyladenine glycosylase
VAYVYLVYGIHHCLNVVTEEDGCAGAVLLRAARPWPDSEVFSGAALPTALIAPLASSRRPYAGPGKLCAGLGVNLRHNGLVLEGEDLYLASDGTPPPRIKTSARVGVAYAGSWANRRLRFLVPGDPHVSGKPRR